MRYLGKFVLIIKTILIYLHYHLAVRMIGEARNLTGITSKYDLATPKTVYNKIHRLTRYFTFKYMINIEV